ncbi:MAG: hypothetical protein KAI66_10745 [Lentisphaeria bacterium]|nr:hypothetical protein [Lentisphaeria bacterium]
MNSSKMARYFRVDPKDMVVVLLLFAMPINAHAAEPPERRFDATIACWLSPHLANATHNLDIDALNRFGATPKSIEALLKTGATGWLSTLPVNCTLSFSSPKPVLNTAYDSEKNAIQVLLHTSVLTSMKMRVTKPLCVLFGQRDQLAVFRFTSKGGAGELIWLGKLDYRLRLPPTIDYTLCQDLTITMGERTLTQKELAEGVTVDCVDQFSDVLVRGQSPMGKPFVHRYEIDAKKLTSRAWKTLTQTHSFLRNGGTPGR